AERRRRTRQRRRWCCCPASVSPAHPESGRDFDRFGRAGKRDAEIRQYFRQPEAGETGGTARVETGGARTREKPHELRVPAKNGGLERSQLVLAGVQETRPYVLRLIWILPFLSQSKGTTSMPQRGRLRGGERFRPSQAPVTDRLDDHVHRKKKKGDQWR